MTSTTKLTDSKRVNKTHAFIDSHKGEFPVWKSDDPFLKPLFRTRKAIRNRDKQFREGPLEVELGVQSNDYDFLVFKDRLSRDATKLLPENVDPDTGRAFGNGVIGNWFNMRHVSGYPARPATFPLVDNSYLREKNDLVNDFVSDRHRRLFRAIVKAFFTDLEPQAVPLRVGASSMCPFYTTDLLERMSLIEYGWDSWDAISASLQKTSPLLGGMTGSEAREMRFNLFRDHSVGGVYHTVYRMQPSDSVNLVNGSWEFKKRPVADILYALTGGRRGTFEPSDKQIAGAFDAPDGFARMRLRTAMGGPLGTNGLLFPIAHAVRKKIYTRYAYTYHHTTRDSSQNDLRKWDDLIAADVSNHDWFWPTFYIDEICSVLLDLGYEPGWVELYRMKTFMPNYVTDVGPDEGNVLMGDWLDPNSRGGLPSGNAFTDIEGTLGMTFVYMLIQLEHTADHLLFHLDDDAMTDLLVDEYLKGNLYIKLKDKSDDALLGWSEHPGIKQRVSTLRDLMRGVDKGELSPASVSPYMKVTYEHGGAFLGSVLLFDRFFDHKKLTLIGNISSFVRNRFSPEYGIQSGVKDRSRAKRPYWGLGWLSKMEAYGSCPAYSEILELIEFHWGRVYGESYIRRMDDLADVQIREAARAARAVQAAIGGGFSDLSAIDLEVLADPSKAHYKFTDEDISPAVFASLFKGLPLEASERFFNKIYPGGKNASY